MPDDKTKTAQDRQRIDVSQDYELQYWSEKFGVSKDQLKAAVQKVGTMADDVAHELTLQTSERLRRSMRVSLFF